MKGKLLLVGAKVSKEARDLMESLIQRDPKVRMSLSDVRKPKWFAGMMDAGEVGSLGWQRSC